MSRVARLAQRWRNVPLTVGLAVILLLIIGLGVIVQNEGTYQAQKIREAHVQAEILAASVTAALDFRDAPTAQEAADALRVNPQVNAAGVYDESGAIFAGYVRDGTSLPKRISTDRQPNPDLIEALVPVTRGGESIGSVYLALIREPISRRVARYSLIALLVIMAALVVIVLGIAQSALRRANRQLEERAHALGAAYDELQVQVEEREKAEEQLRQAQKMQALGQLTGGIAHDFNNLLTVIQGSADILRRPNLPEPKRVRFAEAIVETAARAAALTSQLLAFARRQPLQPEVLDLNASIDSMTELLDRTLGELIDVRTELAEGLCAVEADPSQLEAAVLNIAVNARDAMPEGGTLLIRTAWAELPEAESAIALSISDTGEGMDTETLARVFEPFFTTKAVGKGTGLGLSQVYGFAAQSGGDASIESISGEGTTVTIILPCSSREATRSPSRDAVPARHKTGAVLLVDDNEEVGTFAEALLTELGHRVARARTAPEALDLAREKAFDAVFTDVVMPGMSGLELAEALKALRPGLPIVLTTGYSDEIATSGTGGLPVVFKPYRLETLANVLDQVLRGENSAPAES